MCPLCEALHNDDLYLSQNIRFLQIIRSLPVLSLHGKSVALEDYIGQSCGKD